MHAMHMLNQVRRVGRTTASPVAGVLRAIAGAAYGHSRTRRGSAIVLSVSALVLLSVLTLVYWGLGRSDAHTAITLRRATNVDTTVDHIAQHLADVIARDKTAWYVEVAIAGSSVPAVYREAWDFPWVDPTRLSIPGNVKNFDRDRFDPAGTMPQSWDPTGPNALNILPFEGSDPWLAPHQPVFLNMTTALTGPDWMIDARDWWSISNFAPDGRFVNLYNLRNNFEAPSGFTNNGQSTAISRNLWLIDAAGNATKDLYGGGSADQNIPAHWTMYQQYAFRPTVEVNYRVDDPRYAFYQWADTDGDGFFDARWFELVDASVNNRLISLLPQDDSIRWFFAARAVDLTGLVNVNTATDLRGGDTPTSSQGDDEFRLGTTAADIDFLRILSLQDSSRQSFVDPTKDGGYSGLLRFDPQTGAGPIAADYLDYDMVTAAKVAEQANAARSEYYRLKAMPPAGQQPLVTLSAEGRHDQYIEDGTGVLPGQAIVDVTGSGSWQTSSMPLFGMPSLLELLTYRGTNDDANTSPLERVLGGRDGINGYFSPLRDNRPLFLERAHSDAALFQNPNTGFAADESMIWSAMDVRQHLTTISGAPEIRSSRLRFDPVIDPITGTPRSFLEAVSQIGGVWNQHLYPNPALANFEGRYNAPELLLAASRGLPRPLFQAYAEALLPHAGELGGVWGDETADDTDTLFYGHDPVRALVTAAQITANAIDMYDNVSNLSLFPTVLTLATSLEAAVQLDNDPRYPAWNRRANTTPVTYPYQLLLNEDDRQIQSFANEVSAVNIFGIEAQPFIIEVNSYFMYSDVWDGNGGDPDGATWTGPPALPPPPKPFTIKGDITFGNADFIMEAIVFQITNPFDQSISLWSGSETEPKYYIEFGDHIFPLGGIQNQGDYKLTTSYAQLVAGQQVSLNTVSIDAGKTKVFFALSFKEDAINLRLKNTDLNKNLTFSIRNWMRAQFGDDAIQIPVVAQGIAPDEPVEFVERGMLAEESVVRLWRVLDLISDSGTAEIEQTRADDQLVDRLRDPGTAESTLDRTLPLGNRNVSGSQAWEQGVGASNWGDNEGYSIVRSGSIRRLNDGTGFETDHGEFPAWCIELKFGDSLNDQDSIGGSQASLGMSDFDDTSASGSVTAGTFPMEKLFDEQALPSTNMLFSTLGDDPWKKTNISGPFPVSSLPGGPSYSQIQAEIHLENRRFAGNSKPGHTLRVADMLLPLGVGPMHIPEDLQGSVHDDHRWTTLGETMALTLGFDAVPFIFTPGDRLLINLHRVFDKGHLRLDTENQTGTLNPYIPFVDLNKNGRWDPPGPGPGEPTRGAGIPIAYNVLDVFTTTDARFGSMRRPRLGVINVNTAPLNVLRTVPMLSPPAPISGGPKQWWWAGVPDAPTERSDVAASVFAYARKGTIPSIAPNVGAVDFSDGGFFGDPFSLARSNMTKFDGIRETPGFRSLGELMVVRGGKVGDRFQDIDYIGRDGSYLDMKGVDSIRYKSGDESEQMIDDYDEKLAVINGVLGTTSVRSDYFAVWFVVQGYQRDDVEGLRPATGNRPADPLTPTVTKRFVMVVDRTNVQRLGDKPRILMIQEVPM